MVHRIQDSEDVVWLLRHTRAFRGGHIAELHVSRRHLFDENTCGEVLAGTTVTILIRYAVEETVAGRLQRLQRLARLRLLGVTDFSFFEQKGTNSGLIEALQAEVHHGQLRFWFDQYGEIYVVCEEAQLEEVCVPGVLPSREVVKEWVYQASEGILPTVSWLLAELDRAGVPCVWRPHGAADQVTNGTHWQGVLARGPGAGSTGREVLWVEGFGPLGGGAFGLIVRARERDEEANELLLVLADIVTRNFSGESVGADTAMPYRA